MKKRFIFFLLIAVSAFAYYKYTKYKREELIKRRISQIKNIDQAQLANILDRVQKTRKQIKTTGLIKPKKARRLRPRKHKSPVAKYDNESYSNDDELETEYEDTGDDEEDIDEDDEDNEDKPNVVKPMRGRFKPISPAALKKIREAAKARMKQLIERENEESDEEEE